MCTYGTNEQGGEEKRCDATKNRVSREVNTNYGEAEPREEEEPKPMLQFGRELSSDLIKNVHITVPI
eukprot:15054222-Ditylum_brightwellii.AAC.1